MIVDLSKMERFEAAINYLIKHDVNRTTWSNIVVVPMACILRSIETPPIHLEASPRSFEFVFSSVGTQLPTAESS
jgi:hypothetical protein